MGSRVATATLQTIWDCRWSRLRPRAFDVEPRRPTNPWVCVRGGDRRPVTEEECGNCPYWEEMERPAMEPFVGGPEAARG
jgi:hypothetical protein